MFTGLIETVGTLKGMTRHSDGAVLAVSCSPFDAPLVKGESVAVQGACLTVTDIDQNGFRADVLAETLRRTNLGGARRAQFLNLERAVRVGDRLGGHFVSGHVDATGTLDSIRMDGRDRVLRIRGDGIVLAELIEKGSVTLDGVSLTVSALDTEAFEVCVIPWTWGHTSLPERVAGDLLNIETDMIGKYIRRHLASPVAGPLTEQKLAAAGFLGDGG